MNSSSRKLSPIDHSSNKRAEDQAAQAARSGHDVIVIGASAGGIEALRRLVRDLPAGLPASVFVVVHLAPQGPSLLPAILRAAGPLPVSQPNDGQIFELGHIYVAPPNCHIMLEEGIIKAVRGPRENMHRPSIDPLFRSAARYYGPRVIGVILTGMLDDGSAGLLAVKSFGGVAIVQEPTDADYPDMPTNALRAVRDVDHVVPLDELGALLAKLANEVPELPASTESGAPDTEHSVLGTRYSALSISLGARQMTDRIDIEDEFAKSDIPPVEMMDKLGTPFTIACPECHGTLWEIRDGELLRFRCRVGHAYTAQSLLSEHSESLESALWVAFRTLEESASLNRRLAERASDHNQLLSASRFMENAVEIEQHAETIRRVLVASKAVDEENGCELMVDGYCRTSTRNHQPSTRNQGKRWLQ